MVVLSVSVIVVDRDTVTDLAEGLIVVVDVTVERNFVAVRVWVTIFVVVLQTETVFGGGLGHTFSQAGQIKLLSKPFSHAGGLMFRRTGAASVGIGMVLVSVTAVVWVANIVV
jgi:hypothetical protein